MELKPADLGPSFGGAILKNRGGTDVASERQQALAMAATSAVGTGLLFGINGPIYGLLGGVLTGGVFVALVPRWRRRLLHETPVSAAELQRLRPQKTGSHPLPLVPNVMDTIFSTLLGQPLPQAPQRHTLEDAYFELLAEVQALRVATPENESELRETLRSLSESVAALPPIAPVNEAEITDLVVDAEALLFRSNREKDPIVAESLQRQAEAAVRRARALQNAATLARRSKTLREEIYRQIGALRASLPSYSQASQAIATGQIHELAQSVNRIAKDAASVVAAQEELAQTLSPEWRYRTPEEPTVQTQRTGR